jgi:hypothetical protein
LAGAGLYFDGNGRLSVKLDPDGPQKFDHLGRIQTLVDDGLTIKPGSPRKIRAVKDDKSVFINKRNELEARPPSSYVVNDSRSVRGESLNDAMDALADDIRTALASASGGSVSVTVDFGASFSHYATAVVTGQSWVGALSEIAASPFVSTNPMETSLFQFSPVVSDIVAGDGFTLSVYTPVKAKGTYTFHCVGS